MKAITKSLSLLLALLMLLSLLSLLAGCTAEDALHTAADLAELLEETETEPQPQVGETVSLTESTAAPVDENGVYTTKDDVALYLHTYGHLPSNFITKAEARAAGWEGGSLEPYCPGMCIGGDRFGNREGLLPDAAGRVWTECDINTLGASSRGAERIVFSNDGLIYYTGDHYESFEQLYP